MVLLCKVAEMDAELNDKLASPRMGQVEDASEIPENSIDEVD